MVKGAKFAPFIKEFTNVNLAKGKEPRRREEFCFPVLTWQGTCAFRHTTPRETTIGDRIIKFTSGARNAIGITLT